MKFAEIVRQARKKKGLSQLELSSHFGRYGGAVFNDLENEEFIPKKQEFIAKLADVLDINSDGLFIALKVIPDDIKKILLSDASYFEQVRKFKK